MRSKAVTCGLRAKSPVFLMYIIYIINIGEWMNYLRFSLSFEVKGHLGTLHHSGSEPLLFFVQKSLKANKHNPYWCFLQQLQQEHLNTGSFAQIILSKEPIILHYAIMQWRYSRHCRIHFVFLYLALSEKYYFISSFYHNKVYAENIFQVEGAP